MRQNQLNCMGFGAQRGGGEPYGIKLNMLIPGDLPADDPRMVYAGRAERLGALSAYNDKFGAKVWTEADSPMPDYVAEIKSKLTIQKRMRRCVVSADRKVKYLHPGDSSKYLDGTLYSTSDGNVMVEIPKFWYKIFADGDWIEMWISSMAAPGFIVHPAFQKIIDGILTEVNSRYVGAYEAVLVKSGNPVNIYNWTPGAIGDRLVTAMNNYATGDKLSSMPGYLPCSSMNISNFRTAARAIDGNTDDSTWRQMDSGLYHAIQMLMVIEYGSWNSQKSLTGSILKGMSNISPGNWYNMLSGNIGENYYPIIPTGLTNTLGNASGAVNLQSAYPTSLPSANIVGTLPGAPNGWTKAGTKYTHAAGSTDPIEFAFTPTPESVYRVKFQYYATAGSISASFGGVALSLSPGRYNVAYITATTNDKLVITPTADYVGEIDYVVIATNTGIGITPDDVITSYRGIENLYGHIWKWVDGVILDFASTTQMTLKVANGNFNDTANGYTTVAKNMAIPGNGYVHKLQNAALQRVFYAASTGGVANADIGISDYYYNTGVADKRVVAAGGFAIYGGYAGAFYVLANSGPPNAYPNVGGRLCL